VGTWVLINEMWYYAALQGSRNWVKAQQGWRWAEIATGHDAMVMAPDELTRMLIGVS